MRHDIERLQAEIAEMEQQEIALEERLADIREGIERRFRAIGALEMVNITNEMFGAFHVR